MTTLTVANRAYADGHLGSPVGAPTDCSAGVVPVWGVGTIRPCLRNTMSPGVYRATVFSRQSARGPRGPGSVMCAYRRTPEVHRLRPRRRARALKIVRGMRWERSCRTG